MPGRLGRYLDTPRVFQLRTASAAKIPNVKRHCPCQGHPSIPINAKSITSRFTSKPSTGGFPPWARTADSYDEQPSGAS